MKKPEITIIVTQRERFSFTKESLESIYKFSSLPFKLIYVDGNSPAHIKQYLDSESQERGFKLLRSKHYLFPNRARNIGLKHVDTKYLIFIDNDVVVSEGWLEGLMNCVKETGAVLVSPLICIGLPLHENIHNGGGEIKIEEKTIGGKVIREFSNKDSHGGSQYQGKLSNLKDEIHRGQWDYIEFHCMLIETEIFKKTSVLDEDLMSTREHIDFCMSVRKCGGDIFMEPSSLVTYVPGKPKLSDLIFFMLRWSDKRHRISINRFKEKWGLNKVIYKRSGFRRHRAYISPFVNRIPLVNSSVNWKDFCTKRLKSLDRYLNRVLCYCYDRK